VAFFVILEPYIKLLTYLLAYFDNYIYTNHLLYLLALRYTPDRQVAACLQWRHYHCNHACSAAVAKLLGVRRLHRPVRRRQRPELVGQRSQSRGQSLQRILKLLICIVARDAQYQEMPTIIYWYRHRRIAWSSRCSVGDGLLCISARYRSI